MRQVTTQRWTVRAPLLWVALVVAGCHGGVDHPPQGRTAGQTSFVSAPPPGNAMRSMVPENAGAATPGSPSKDGVAAPTRTVQETDIYRVEGNRLYYLNGYRGLMVFDITDVDHPSLLGRSPLFGSPVEMIVNNGVATVVIADWYGSDAFGAPFYGSVVRGLDATDPAHIKSLGDAQLGGWVRDLRVVGNVLYAVSVDEGMTYGWGMGMAPASGGGTASNSFASRVKLIVSSVNFAQGAVKAVGHLEFPGYQGVFNVTPSSILLAHDAADLTDGGNSSAVGKTELVYLDISDPGGAIAQRSAFRVNGATQGWGPDNGRWNLDFADGVTAHVLACQTNGSYCQGSGYTLSTVSFANPTAPVLKSELAIPGADWMVAARFDSGRLYLSPETGFSPNGATTPFQIYDLSNDSAPVLAGSVDLPGTVWNILLAPQSRIFALGNNWSSQAQGDSVSLSYVDVTHPAAPAALGTSTFGSGWAWTPAAGTFKAFTLDATQGLVVVPFSSWGNTSQGYVNGLQLVEFTPNTVRTAGVARTHGWVERGVFAKGRLLSLSDTTLAVIDYTVHDAPVVKTELTLARNVVSAAPNGDTIAEVSGDFWGKDHSTSEVRVLPLSDAEESTDLDRVKSVTLPGSNAQVFRNAALLYVVTEVTAPAPCAASGGSGIGVVNGPTSGCSSRSEQVQVVDVSGTTPRLRGTVTLPGAAGRLEYMMPWIDFGWYNGSTVLQVGADALAFRRWERFYGDKAPFVSAQDDLLLVDLSKPDAPSVASLPITTDTSGWWGNMQVVGNTLYTTHEEWYQKSKDPASPSLVRYFADRIDVSDRAHPRVQAKINVPGMIVGGSAQDPALLYTVDYRWTGNTEVDDLDVIRVSGNTAELVSTVTLDGYVGQTFIRGNTAYFSANLYSPKAGQPTVELHAVDLSEPSAPKDHVATGAPGWSWLLAVEGNVAVVQSGWRTGGVDLYLLQPGHAPVYRQSVRTSDLFPNQISRQGNSLYLASGLWGVQRIDLQ